ncbi:MAG: CPBP family intramembrane glutamic endopeptidase [Verrucomicrobiaceae bacterium]
MRRSALGDVIKIVAYFVGAFVLAALITPPLYEIGKGFADVALEKDTADELKWLAGKAEKAEFDTYFKRALMLSAVLLLFPLISSLRMKMNPRKLQNTPWSVYLPQSSIASAQGQPLRNPRFGILQLLTGFLLGAGFFLALAWFLFHLNWFSWAKAPDKELLTLVGEKAIKPAIIVSIVEEVVFRGALLGIFLRAFRPGFAIISLSLLFAALHFLQPPDGATVSDPTSMKAGFEMLSLIGQRFMAPQAMLYEFASLFLVGLILGIARYGTASLWLPIGLHASWVFALKAFGNLTLRRPDLPQEFDIYIGRNLKEGILPLVTLAITGIVIALYIRFLRPPDPQESPFPEDLELRETA